MADPSMTDTASAAAFTVASSALATASPTISSAASLATSTLGTMASSTVSSWVTVSGTLPNGEPATTVVPYLDPYATLSPPTNDMVLMQKFGDHEYNLWSLTNNPLLTSSEQCFIGSCNLVLSHTHYLPAAGPTLFLIAFFAAAFLFHLPLSIWRKNWGYGVGMFLGTGLEVAGYVGRYRQRTNPFLQTNFLLNIICLTIGPAFLTASIYLCLARIIMAYGSANARFKPAVYTTTFMLGDFVSLVLQGAGGGIASTANGGSSGTNIMIAGLAFQVASLFFFILLSLDFAVCLRRGRGARNADFQRLTGSLKWKGFLLALAVATVTIFIRCCYRVAELSKGFASDFANEEVAFSILESAMIGIAVLALSVAHPAFVFGSTWAHANFSLRGRKLPQSSRASDSSGDRAKEGRVGVREMREDHDAHAS